MRNISVLDKVRFDNKVFEKPYAPYYDAYKGHIFEIVRQAQPDRPFGDIALIRFRQ